MIKNPLFTLVLGLMGGLALGYIFAEKQSVPPAIASSPLSVRSKLPAEHPRKDSTKPNTANQQVVKRATELQKLLAGSPNDVKLMAALGNLYFDASRWGEAREWYEKILQVENGDADVMTDLAVVYRKLKQPDRALAMLDDVVRDYERIQTKLADIEEGEKYKNLLR